MIWTLRRVRDLALHPRKARVPAHPRRRSTNAPKTIEELDRRRRAHARGGRQDPRGIPRAAEGGARRRPKRSCSAPARPPRRTSTRPKSAARRSSPKRPSAPNATSRSATKRALDDLRREVADLTILATEKVTRKTLDSDDQRRLVEEALGELDLSGPVLRGREQQLMDELARVYARSLFEVAREQGKLDVLREQLGQFADALDAEPPARGVLLLALLLDRRRSRTALARMLDGADAAFAELPLAADRKPPHAGHLPHPPAVRAAVGGGEPHAPGRDHQRGRARRDRRPTSSAERSASAPGAASRSPRASTPTSSAASS